jgi:CheY-like chemotaxis protein
MTILVIEDSRFLRFALEKMLVKAGHHVIAVGNGQEGLRQAQETRPDVILLDMMLPTLEGTEVLRHLKRNPLTQPIPVIVLSSLSQRNEEKLKMAGAAAYFEKSKLNLEEDGSVLVDAVEHVRADQIASPGAVV